MSKSRSGVIVATAAGGLAVLAGSAASLKTFLAIDIAFSVATGHPWAGNRVEQGLVVYVVAEGSGGFPARLEAWKRDHGAAGRPQGVLTLTCPVELMQKGDVDDLLAELDRLPETPVLVIVGTLARCFVGGEENSARRTWGCSSRASIVSDERPAQPCSSSTTRDW